MGPNTIENPFYCATESENLFNTFLFLINTCKDLNNHGVLFVDTCVFIYNESMISCVIIWKFEMKKNLERFL